MDHQSPRQLETDSIPPETAPISVNRQFRWPTPVTALVIAISIPATFWSWTNPTQAFATLYAYGAEPWLGKNPHALITSAFLHGDFMHLVFNLWWMWELGSFLERRVGAFRYVILILAAAAFGSVAQLAWNGEMGIGLSGVVYAVFGLLLTQRNHDKDTAAILPLSRVGIFVGWFFLCIALTHSGMMNVANMAHAAGLITGLWFGAGRYSALRPFRIPVGVLALMAGVGVFFWAPWLENWHFAQLYRLDKKGDTAAYQKAAKEFTNRFPENDWTLQYAAWEAQTQHDYPRAAEILAKQLTRSRSAITLNNLAWLRATCPDAALRNGHEAVQLAEEACNLSGWRESNMINTLAAAYAEAGRYQEAVATNLKAVAVATDKESLAPYTKAFSAGRPWREVPSHSTHPENKPAAKNPEVIANE
jgi:membrane associated rhomboid family serine protease